MSDKITYSAVEQVACEGCQAAGKDTSGDNRTVYADGSHHCQAGCGDNLSNHEAAMKSKIPIEPKAIPKQKQLKPLIPIGEYKAIPSRGITYETAKKYKCTVAVYNNEKVLCMSYYDKGAVVAQKIKLKRDSSNPKKPKCIWLGDSSQLTPLWGMNLYEPNIKLSVTICEGEPDMLCRSSLNGDRWPVLSLLHGAGSQSLKGISEAKEYLLGFKRVILMFDGDEVGRKCAQAAAEILGPKAKIAQMLDGEDVCSLVQKNQQHLISQLELSATGHRPKDIVTISDYTDKELYSSESKGIELPYPILNKMLRGLKRGALYMFAAGSGLGKSTVVKEIAYYLMFKMGIKVGCIFLEQGDKSAMKDYIAMDNLIEAEDFNENPDLVSQESKDKSRAVLSRMGVFYKHFGSLDSDKLISKIENMMVGCECDFVILDHISMVVSGNLSAAGERKDIDVLMTKLRTLIEITGKSVIAVSHLKRPPGDSRDYNNGAKVHLSALRGSASLEQLSDYVIALERNQFSEEEGNQLKLKVLKSRRGGKVGYADKLKYSFDTGRLSLVDENKLNNEEI